MYEVYIHIYYCILIRIERPLSTSENLNLKNLNSKTLITEFESYNKFKISKIFFNSTIIHQSSVVYQYTGIYSSTIVLALAHHILDL